MSDREESGTTHEEMDALIRSYGRLIRSIVAKVGRGRVTDLEDIEQEVGLALWKVVRGEQKIDHPSSYIYRCAVRETVRAIRNEERRSEEALRPDETAGPHPRDPEQSVAQRETERDIEACLGELRPLRRQAVRAHLAGFSVGEIMGLYDWSYQKARNLISRGLADLRRLLRARGRDEILK